MSGLGSLACSIASIPFPASQQTFQSERSDSRSRMLFLTPLWLSTNSNDNTVALRLGKEKLLRFRPGLWGIIFEFDFRMVRGLMVKARERPYSFYCMDFA
jgi:hypothetical protein